MTRPLVLLIVFGALLALAGCGGTPEKGDKGDKGDAGAAGTPGPQGQAGPPGPPGRDGKDAVAAPQFRVVKSNSNGGVPKPALCGVDEVMVSATCIVPAGDLTLAPTTLGTTGASCGQSSGQSEAPLAIVLCAKK